VEYIKFRKGMPDESAQKAYDSGYYIEAIQILHNFLENQSQSLLTLTGCVHFKSDSDEVGDLTDTIKFINVVKILYILSQITKDEYEWLIKVNSMRNKVIHNIFKEPYNKIYMGIPKNEYDEIFKQTMEQAYLITRKTEEIIEIEVT